MACERCGGLMVSERIYDLQGMNGDLCPTSYRCLLCGDLVDTVILENRSRSTGAVEPMVLRRPRMQRLVAV
ncbi:MAG: hypothetical protein Q8L77_12540 [Nitrospirota bacterium]|nr:hypothetical protein [Nitrospirota bacterium]